MKHTGIEFPTLLQPFTIEQYEEYIKWCNQYEKWCGEYKEDPDEWYAALLNRLKDQSPA